MITIDAAMLDYKSLNEKLRESNAPGSALLPRVCRIKKSPLTEFPETQWALT